MKSVLISLMMFAVLGAMIYFGVLDFLASVYMQIFAVLCVIGALIFAFVSLGNPFAKDKKNDSD